MKLSRFWLVVQRASDVGVIAAVGLVLWVILRPSPQQLPEIRIPNEPVVIEGATKGSRSAPVAMILYSDFQCPFCGRFAREVLPKIEELFVTPGRVLLVFRHMPLPIHPLAVKAAEAAECAGAQGRFWEMHDLLFANPSRLETEALKRDAEVLKLQKDQFEACLGGEMSAKVRKDKTEGESLGQVGTPTFLFGKTEGNRVKVTLALAGVQPLAGFEAAFAAVLSPPKPTWFVPAASAAGVLTIGIAAWVLHRRRKGASHRG